jgi:hypothetical protein
MDPRFLNPYNVVFDQGSIWHQAIFVGLALLYLAVLLPLWRRIGWPLTLFLAYVGVYCLFGLEYPYLLFPFFEHAFRSSMAQTWLELTLPVAFFLAAPRAILVRVPYVFPLVAVWEIGRIWFGPEGLMKAPSFDTAFLALLLPFIGSPLKRLMGPRSGRAAALAIRAAMLGTIVAHHGSTAFLVLIAEVLVLFRPERKWLRVGAFAAVVAGFGALAVFHSNGPWLDGSERIQVWLRDFSYWWTVPRFIAVGTGPGTFMWADYMIAGFVQPMFPAMHSDILQVLFEFGLIGFALASGVFADALHRAWRNPKLLAGVFGVLAFSTTYHPARFFPTAFLAAWILWRVLDRDRKVWDWTAE